MDYEKLHREVLFPEVRVKTDKAGGSGTIIYSQPNADGYSTYVVSCHHVIDDALSVRKEWSSKLGIERKKEYRQVVTVEFFDYSNVPHGQRPVNNSVDAEIVAYDKDHDMTLLKLRTVKQAQYVAKLMAPGDEKQLMIGQPTVAVGAAMLHDPILTMGILTHFGDEIDYKDYWMSNAQIIFGNSGGAMFADTERGYEFIGIPSRVAVAGWGSAVTHLGYFSPITRVLGFFHEQGYHFLVPGDTSTEADCLAEIKKSKDEAEKNSANSGE